MMSCPLPLRTGSKFVDNLFWLVKVKGHKSVTCSIADFLSFFLYILPDARFRALSAGVHSTLRVFIALEFHGDNLK